MDLFIFFLLSSLTFIGTEALDANCPAVRCTDGAPDIRFPFRVEGQQPQRCGYPGFELSCKQNLTIIHFPSYGDLVVKSISYDIKKLSLLDPKNCVHEVFLNLNLTLTAFRYYYVVKNYTYLNCSAALLSSSMPVPCLSGSSYYVYVVESSETTPVSCKAVRTIAIPFAYSPYLSDNRFGLGLTWDSTGCEDCEAKGVFLSKSGLPLPGCFMVHEKVIGFTIFIFMVATLISVKTYCSKKLECCSKKNNQLELL
ncbi:RING-H2 finger protein ATL22-like [Cornus florida]|uniref:RING-H2 finger protein ATL22-like n=1 Tax=Cornus florida TaxID=4283 RepID=UPI002899B051|nr:RING-H2 finger protein ATL22-like [Cornus florida]